MHIVINIPEEVLNRICFPPTYPLDMVIVCNAIHEHIKLPKGHGRLIDADALLSKAKLLYKGYEIALTNIIGDAPTIIEADKEVEE